MSGEQGLDLRSTIALVQSGGHLSRRVKGFEARPQQWQMMSDIITAYNENAIALIEAGTGTGKSMAYLIPAMLWALRCKERTLIATNTIALQEQLLHKDIPMIINALGLDLKAVLVKGMGNYACIRKLADLKQEFLLLSSAEQQEVEKIDAWAASTQDGSRSSLPMMPSNNIWEQVAADSDACSGPQCPFYQHCFFFKARRHAEEAQILVANHHLLFADLAVRAETGNYNGTAILPNYSRIVLDEAHHIEDVATDFFGTQVSKIALLRILARLASDKQGKATGKLVQLRDKVQNSVCRLPNSEGQDLLMRLNIDFPSSLKDLQQKIGETFAQLANFAEERSDIRSGKTGTQAAENESKLRLHRSHYNEEAWQNQVMPTTAALLTLLARYTQMLSSLESDLSIYNDETLQEQTKLLRQEIIAMKKRLELHRTSLDDLVMAPVSTDKVRWIESHRHKALGNVSVTDADLDIAKAMVDNLLNKFNTIIMCSATITANQKFDFLRQRLGITDEGLPERKVITAIYDSPFDFAKQSLLAIASDMPSPEERSFNHCAAEQIWHILQVSRGGTFVLFTSYDMMQQCYQQLAGRLEEHRFQSFKQGQQQRHELLASFKSAPRAVLFGTDSFWEGVDVAGEALRCVIIVKLPFKVPTEPIVEARSDAMRQRGEVPFIQYLLPQAIVKFKQGVGRLIRNKNDRGCIICLDKRLISKGYGQQFINSLPPCQLFCAPLEQICAEMRTFYRRTHHLVTQANG